MKPSEAQVAAHNSKWTDERRGSFKRRMSAVSETAEREADSLAFAAYC